MICTLLLLALAAPHEPAMEVQLVSAAGTDSQAFFDAEVPEGAAGVIVGGLGGEPELWPDLLAAGGWDVVALRWDDPLDLDLERIVVTNREPAVRPVLERQVSGRELAFLAVTVPPPGSDTPGLGEPEAAVRKALADVEADVPVVLLVAGPREQAAAILRNVPGIALAIVAGAGSGDPQPLQIGEAWLVEAPWGGVVWGVTTVRFTNGRIADVAHRFELPQGVSEAITEVRQRHGLAAPVETLMQAVPDDPEAMESTRRFANRACRFSMYGMRLVEQYGTLEAPAGGKLLVVDLAMENIIPMTLVEMAEVPTEYRMQNLADHLYVVVNGNRLARIVPAADQAPGHVPVQGFRLERLGESVRGNVVFALPPEEVKSLELRLYDFAHGHAQLSLVPAPAGWEPGEPAVPVQVNEIVEAGVYEVRVTDNLDGQAAPEGMVMVTVDLRARSMFTFEADATAFDPHAEPGTRIDIGTVSDWLEAHTYMQLILDGQYAYGPTAPPVTRLPDEPRFLPDVMTGGEAVFLVPETFDSIELRCDFPNARLPGGEIIRPAGLVFQLEGERPEPPTAEEPIWSVRDDTLEVVVADQHVHASFAGERAGAGRRLLVLDVSVINHGEEPEFFQVREQMRYADPDGRSHEVHAATWAGPRRPAEHVWVPAGEQRAFQLVYDIADDADLQPRLSYRGFELAETVSLPPIAEARPEAAEATDPAAEVPDPPMPLAEVDVPDDAEAPEPAAARVPIHPDREPLGLAGAGLTPEQVNDAIDRGADYLWEHLSEPRTLDRWLNSHGSYVAYNNVYALALVHAGLHERNEAFDAAMRQYLDTLDLTDISWHRTYQMGVLAMLIEGYGHEEYLPQLERVARWLVEAQGPRGIWGYNADVPESLYLLADHGPMPPLAVAGGRPLDELDQPAERWQRITDWEVGADKDYSVAQFALLGLHSAERAGLAMPRELWERTLPAHLDGQQDDGGWSYTWFRRPAYGSMTCAGIAAVAIAQHALGEDDPAIREAIERGLAWLDEHFAVDHHPPGRVRVPVGGEWHYYYLYSLERVGRILDTEFIGEHEWYPLGARYLIDRQRPDGSWPEGGERPEELATAFALLFLTRATPTLAPQEIPRGGQGTLVTRLERTDLPGRVYIMLDASGSLLQQRDGRMLFEHLRDAVHNIVRELPDDTQVALRVFGHQYRAIDPEANEDTRLEIPMGPLDRPAFEAELNTIRPRGKTPLALTLREAARDLARLRPREDDPVLVLLIADGEENTLPRQDPVEAAGELAEITGLDVRVVGFDIDQPIFRQTLEAITELTGGVYYEAELPEDVPATLGAAVFPQPAGFRLVDAAGEPVHEGAFGDVLALSEGEYRFVTEYEGQSFEQTLWINTDRSTVVRFNPALATTADARPEPLAD